MVGSKTRKIINSRLIKGQKREKWAQVSTGPPGKVLMFEEADGRDPSEKIDGSARKELMFEEANGRDPPGKATTNFLLSLYVYRATSSSTTIF